MKRTMTMTLVATLLMALAMPRTTTAHPRHGDEPLIQIAILLDTSNSMDGLINQAKSQLWKIVNEFVKAKRRGCPARIQVALYQYGNDNLAAREGYIQLVQGFTTDLDLVSEKLFALTTNGGSEHCGQVMDTARKQLDWSTKDDDLKVIVIAGNEPFTQGPVDYRNAIEKLIKRQIIVDTIHCGPYQTGVQTGWSDGARLAKGTYLNIDSDRQVVHIVAPQDDEIARLGAELNKTYIPYGQRGRKASMRQEAEDANAESVKQGSMVNRSVFKASTGYVNESWDLVDATKNNTVSLAEVDEEALPAEMRKMDDKERAEHIAEMAKKRARLQKKIRKLNEKREAYVAKKEKEKAGDSGAETLDSAMIKTLRAQAVERNFSFDD